MHTFAVGPSAEVEAIVNRFMAARMEGDIERVKNLLSESAILRLIGTDEDEWAAGHDTVVGVMGAHWDALRVLGDTRLRLEAFENGDTAWAALEGRRVGEELEFKYRVTFVLTLDRGSWKIVQIHYSVPVPNEEIFSVELNQTLSNLLEALQVDAGFTSFRESASDTSTILFTDIVGSTEITRSLGDREWSLVIGEHLSQLRQIVEQQRGSVVKTLGDGGMYVFSSASAALWAATGIQRAMQGSGIAVRIGAHSGDVIRDRDDYLGLTVNKAARVAAAAQAGQILVSSTTAGLVDLSEFQFAVPITVELEGFEGTHQLQPLIWH